MTQRQLNWNALPKARDNAGRRSRSCRWRDAGCPETKRFWNGSGRRFGTNFWKRESELRSGEDELGRARSSYIRVADSTIGRYVRALKELSSRACMEVDVRRPKLTEDDNALREAGLDVRLGFDGKRPISISDPKLSGGQKVLASLLLLVALTYEGEQEGGGFFILDEQFPHLSVERIDLVAKFISQTRSQFLLTTPTTHNFAVFNAAKLLLTLRKKKPEMAAAPPPLYVRC